MSEKIDEIKEKIVNVLKKHGIARAGIFGSYATGKQKKNSDVDILIEFNGNLIDLVGIELELKKKLRKKIDLLTYGGIHPLLKKRILGEEVRIL
jgi:uncharacterized protein